MSNPQEYRPLLSAFGPTPAPLCLIDTKDRGLGLITTVPIKPGEVVLEDSPCVLYPWFDSIPLICSRCFRVLPSEPFPCTKCKVARFCSPRCLSLSHPSLLCHALPSLTTGKYRYPDLLIFLLSAYSLPNFSICLLLSLHSNSQFSRRYIDLLHSQLTSLISSQNPPLLFSHRNTSSLLSKERNNSFTLPIPKNHIQRFQAAGIYRARASGLYLWASMLNHECMPNVSPFVHIDGPEQENNTNLKFRAMHEIKEGSEICTSYGDFIADYRQRQEHLQRRYEFKCRCKWCRLESRWKDNQEEQGEGKKEKEETEEKNDDMDVDEAGNKEEILEGIDTQLDDFLEEFVCVCGGFLARLPPSPDGAVSNERECNVCGVLF